MFATKEPYYYIILIMLLAVMFLTYVISRSKLGYYLIAMAVSSFLTALAGTFYAQFSMYIHLKSIISSGQSRGTIKV